ncbi:MAG: extracellular solute-binding protein [Nostocales cyanobacterium]|nr:MAG: extracellular solute-binding protein [Nostocales cyanobacterium]TAF16708.1 MAG: extracellular solute-binding protein [Nostocales cyanobacterium]
MDRRSFLLGTSGILVSQILAGCDKNNQTKLTIQLLKGSVPGQVVNQFKKIIESESQTKLKFIPTNQISVAFKQLQTWQQPKKDNQEDWQRLIPLRQNSQNDRSDLLTLGDFWLKAAIEQKLIQPIETAEIKQWSALDQKWQQLVKRNSQGDIDKNGQVWGVPYRWGNTVIIYNREKLREFDWQPTDWSDLWREELRLKISLLNHPREVIGLVLKKLGKSYNTENISTIPNLETELKTLNQQVKFYDSTTYLEPLIIGDTWLAVGWSSDIIPILNRYPKLGAVIPRSGTAIWADLWVKPAGIKHNDLQSRWLDFCLQPDIAQQIIKFSQTNSPIPTNISQEEIAQPLRNLLLTNQDIMNKSEFLYPLSEQTNQEYEKSFQNMKNLG